MSTIKNFLKNLISQKEVKEKSLRVIPNYEIEDLYPEIEGAHIYYPNEEIPSTIKYTQSIEQENFKFVSDEGGFWTLVDNDDMSVPVYGERVSFHEIEKIGNDWYGVLGAFYTKLNKDGMPISNQVYREEIPYIKEVEISKSDYFEHDIILCRIHDEIRVLLNFEELSDFTVKESIGALTYPENDPDNGYHNFIKKGDKVIGEIGASEYELDSSGMQVKSPNRKIKP